MKKYLIATTVLAGFAGAAYADDSVTNNGITLYGTVDVGVSYDTHGAPVSPLFPPTLLDSVGSASNKPLLSAMAGGLGNSKIGIKGAEELFEGWSGLFKLETGIDPLAGTLSNGAGSLAANNGVAAASRNANGDSSREGQPFNQAAYAGITNAQYGTLTIGRQNTLQLDASGFYDPQQGAYAFSLLGYTGVIGGGAGDTQDARWDNSIKYLGHFGMLRIGGMYQFGGTVTRNDIGYGVDLGGDYAGFSVDGLYTHKKDQISPGILSAAQTLTLPFGSLTGTISDNTDYSINGKYVFGPFSVSGGYQYIVFANPSSPLPAGTIQPGGYDISVVNNTAFTRHKILQVEFVGGRYKITPDFELGIGYYHEDQNSYRIAGGACHSTVAATCSGTQNNLSVMVDYHLSKRFDVYAGAMYSQVLDGIASGFIHNNNIDPSAGLRFVF